MSNTTRPPRVLTGRALNRALLARQLLLERTDLPITRALEQIGGLQTQYAPSGYIGLWTRVADFRRESLTRALEDGSIVQATLLRVTIHMVSGREYWAYALGVREARRAWGARVNALPSAIEMSAAAQRLRRALLEGPRTVKELGDIASGFLGHLGLWVDLVRVPPSGTWEHRRADRLALADEWLGPADATEDEGLTHLVRAYLRAFGPAPWKDVAAWAGIPVAWARRGGEDLVLAHYRDEAGRDLVDMDGAELPDEDVAAPVRFLPHWDNALLVHARRTGILPEAHRSRVFSSRNPFSVGTYLVDGHVAGAWSWRAGRIVLDSFEELTPAQERDVEQERAALEAFHA